MKNVFLAGWFKFHYAWRGWILACLFLILAWSRWQSRAELEPIGLVIFSFGFFWRIYAGQYIGSHSNGILMGADHLATGGPYRLGRHPLYLANIFSAIGLIVFAHSLPFLNSCLLGLMVIIHHISLAKSEERLLANSFGAPYLDYLNSTNLWFGWRSYKSRKIIESGVSAGPVLSKIPGVWRRQGGNLAKSILALAILFFLGLLGGRAA